MRLISLAYVLTTALAADAGLAETLTARGVVFKDQNRDQVRQPDEPGLGGVLVSNGAQVVRTDARGRYEIEIDAHDATVFVIKPRGYMTPVDELNIPRFSYTHKPEGSPDGGFHFAGVAPTGELPESIDFPLTPVREADRFSIIAFGDPQPYTLEQVDLFRREVIDPVVGEHDIAFGISLGDLVGDQLELFQPLSEAQALFGVPWRNVYGNHDMNAMSGSTGETSNDPDRYADETFERVFGPPTYAFQHGRVHFILMDNVVWQGFAGYRDRAPENWPEARMPKVGNYRGGLRPEQIEFVDNYLDHVPADELVVLAFHIPIEGGGVHRIPEQHELFRVLSSHPNTFSLSGHTHLQRHWFFGPEHGYDPGAPGPLNRRDAERFAQPVHHHLNAATASGSWYRGWRDEEGVPHAMMRCGSPNGYTLVHFDGASYSTEFRPAREAARRQMHIMMPSEVRGPGAEALVNVFHGAEGDDVRARIVPHPRAGLSPTKWAPMTFDPQIDPHYQEVYDRERGLSAEQMGNRGVPDPRPSHHIWSATLPTVGLPAGTHTLEVRHRDLYGIERVGRRTFRVSG